MTVSRYEQETSILYNQEETTATVYTHHPALIRKLDKGCEQFPEQYKFISENAVGGRTYIMPKKCVRVGLPSTYVMSEEQKKATAERMKILQEKRKSILRSENK